MPYEPYRPAPPPPPPSRGGADPALRELLTFMRDVCREAAVRIDRYLGSDAPAAPSRDRFADRGPPPSRDRFDDRGPPPSRDRFDDRGPPPGRDDRTFRDRDFNAPPAFAGGDRGNSVGTREPLERLRDESRRLSHDAPDLDPAELRLRIEAITAETRSLQNRANDPDDRDIAAKILRAMTAVVSEHRPGHVYGLARHHQADWDEVGRRARDELGALGNRAAPPPGAHDDEDDDGNGPIDE